MTMHILAINGSLSGSPSRTRRAVDVALDGAQGDNGDVTGEVLELREFDLQFCDGRPPDRYNNDTREVLRRIASADAYLVATPVYRASLTGALKNLFDLVPNDPNGDDPLRGRAVGLIATGGSHHHYLVIEHQLRPLFGFFGAHTVARSVYAASSDFDADKNAREHLRDDLRALGRDLVFLSKAVRAHHEHLAPAHLRIRRT